MEQIMLEKKFVWHVYHLWFLMSYAGNMSSYQSGSAS